MHRASGRLRKSRRGAGKFYEHQVEAQTGFTTLLPVGPVRLKMGETHPPLAGALPGTGFRLMGVIKAIITPRWREPQNGRRVRK